MIKLEKLDLAATKMRDLAWSDRETYKEFIAQLYYFVRYSTRMLGSAMSLTESESYYDRLVAHISEENKHEKLALKDLANLGGAIADYPEAGITRALWETQFYKIQKSPTSLLGYILALEAIAVRVYPEVWPTLKETYEMKCLNFIRVHSEEDPDHVQKAFQQLDALNIDDRKLATENFEQTCDVLACFFDEITKRADARSSQRKRNQAA